jgi:hypothetical protein
MPSQESSPDSTEPVTWMKLKYSAPKEKGRYRSGHNDNGKAKRKKGGPKTVGRYGERVLVIRNSKRIWVWM